MRYYKIIIFLLLLSLVFIEGNFHILHSGECTRYTEYYIRILEEDIHSNLNPGLREAFSCLVCEGDLRGNRWAGPTTREIFNKCKNSPFKERIIVVCLPYLDLPVGTNDLTYLRFHALKLLAYYGTNKICDYDVFQLLLSEKPTNQYTFRTYLMALAALGDPRTVNFIAATYDSIRTTGVDEHTEDLIALLNCLYHIPGKEAVTLAKSIKSNESVEILIRRAKRVIDRR